MKKLIIPTIGIILLLIALAIAILYPNTYWLSTLIGGLSIGILLGDFLAQRANKRLS